MRRLFSKPFSNPLLSNIDRYLILQTLKSVLMVFIIISCLYTIFSFIANANWVTANYGYFDVLEFIILSLPGSLYLILPVIGLLGTLLALSQLASHSELTAMRAAGVSILRLARPILYSGFLVSLLAFWFGGYVGPYLQHRANVSKMLLSNNRAFLYTAKMVWLKDGNNFILLKKAGREGKVEGVEKFHIKGGQLQNILTAQSGQFSFNKTQKKSLGHWTLYGVKKTIIQNNKISSEYAPQLSQQHLVPMHVLSVLLNQSDNLTLPNLLAYIHYREKNHLDAAPYKLQFWQLIFQPLSAIILMLMALPFVFGPMRNGGLGYRMVFGLLIGFGFFLIAQAAGPVALVYQGSAFWGAALPICIFSLILFLTLLFVN